MPTTTTTYSFNKPVVGADEDDWGGYLNGNWDSVDDLLDGTTPVTGIDINSGTLDGVTIGGTTAGAGTFTTLTATTSITGTLATAAQPNVTSLGTLTGLTVSGSTSLAGASTSADITFGDNDKAIFGAGSDLQIYHDGSNSYISDQGTGNLRVLATNFNVKDATGTRDLFYAQDGGLTKIYYNGLDRIETTSTGIDVTGTVTADGLTVDGGTGNYGIEIEARTDFTGISGQLAITDSTGSAIFNTVSGSLNISTGATFGTNTGTQRLQIGSGGDISFYEDTGTTAKFFWDASFEGVGLGTTTMSRKLNIKGDQGIRLFNDATDSYLDIDHGTDGVIIKQSVTTKDILFRGGIASGQLVFETGGSERMRIDSSGNVGIGLTPSSGNGILQISGGLRIAGSASASDTTAPYIFRTSGVNNMVFATEGTERMRIKSDGHTQLNGQLHFVDTGSIILRPTANALAFNTNGSERMRINSSGYVGIGTSSPDAKIRIQNDNSTVPSLTIRDGGTPAANMVHISSNATGTNFVINSSGQVGIGTGLPAEELDINANNATVRLDAASNSKFGNPTLQFLTNTGNNDYINFGDTDDADVGQIAYVHLSNYMSFTTNASEAMRIDSSGNLLVGTTEAESKLTVNTTRYSTHTTSGGRQYKLFDMASVGANNTFQDIINITSPGGFNSANYYSGLLGTLRVSVVGQTTNYINQVATKTYSVYASMTGTNAITVSLTEVTGFATGTAGTITAQAKSGATASLAAIEAKIAMTSTFSNAKIMYSFECEASTPYPTYQKLTPAVA